MAILIPWLLSMNFSSQLIKLRKQRELTQQQLADTIGVHVNQIKRYEAGTTQPTLDVLVKCSKALHISLDMLVFGEPPEPDEKLRFQLEAIRELEEKDRRMLQEILEGLILRYQAKRWVSIDK